MHFTSIKNDDDFNREALQLFNKQSQENEVYAEYLKLIHCRSETIDHYSQIPFLPISFFRTHQVKTGLFNEELVFSSSGTTAAVTSRHYLENADDYEQSFNAAFRIFYGEPSKYCILALLPAYLEREGSSLVYMARHLVNESMHPQSGFYLDKYSDLQTVLTDMRNREQPVILLGVSFALMDMAEQFPLSFPSLILMETGGMKGRRREIIREELHHHLCKGFGVTKIHSEYGMTELLSQAYSSGNGIYHSPPWMRILCRDVNDPFTGLEHGLTGGINIIDLANRNSCAFIATQDLGRVYPDFSFEILGRFDHSDLRGCNLMIT